MFKTTAQLKEICQMQNSVKTESWYKNLAATVFSVSDMSEEKLSVREEENKLLTDFQQQKQDLIERSKSIIDR